MIILNTVEEMIKMNAEERKKKRDQKKRKKEEQPNAQGNLNIQIQLHGGWSGEEQMKRKDKNTQISKKY